MAPIDPQQLLNALGNLLSNNGGIRSIENVQKISSLMKKFSKKLVSRCVYCHVLKATATDVLNVFLDQDGWFTINLWLSDAKESDNIPFLIDMLQLCRVLPMTLDRLKQNNTAKVAKTCCKSPNETVKKLAIEVVTRWMKLIKGEHVALTEKPVEKVKKKKKKDKPGKVVKKQKVVNSLPKNNVDEKETKEHINNKVEVPVAAEEVKKSDDDDDDDDYDDDKETEMADSVAKIREPRPKTVKTFQTKFRSTGLIEETPLPKLVIKKSGVVDRTAVAAAKIAVKRNNTPLLPSFPEKKIKPSSLITPADQANSGPGIKLIPPKPKPVHILHESAGFMDALVSAPVPVRKRKKSQGKGGTPTSPTTPPPTAQAPKLQFYKDTLEMNESESAENSQGSEESQKKDSKDGDGEEPMDADAEDKSKEENKEKMDTSEETEGDSTAEGGNKLRSILCHVKRRDKKKSVKWAEETALKEFFYFDLDETERVNVNNMKNFGDMKSLEMKREREAFETSKRLMLGDKMSEGTMWSRLQLIDIPPPIVVPGCNSTERELQSIRQQTTLQEIYFSRQMIPDTPREPDAEQHIPQEAQVIPLDDLSNPGQVVDYSTMDLPSPKAALPPVLTNLMMSITGQVGFQSPVEDIEQDMIQPPPNEMQLPIEMPTMGGILGATPEQFMANQEQQYLGPPPNVEGSWQQEWRGPESEGPPGPMMDGFFPQDMGMSMGLPPNVVQSNMRGGGLRNHHMLRHGMDVRLHGGMQHMRGNMMGLPRNRAPRSVICKHFMSGTCRFGANCKFLHPGVNGPML